MTFPTIQSEGLIYHVTGRAQDWESDHFKSLGPNFLICGMGMRMKTPLQGCKKKNWRECS